jgi:glycosyltransferase involved in cell wall biosynthesis
MTSKIAFAVPGDIETLTGGYLYDLKLMKALSASGLSVQHMAWGDSFPFPTLRDADDALAQLQGLPADQPAVVDGLAYGALDTEGLRRVTAPLFALVHHPLALEPGLDPDIAREMEQREKANLAIAQHIFVTSPHTGAILRTEYGVAAEKITVVMPGFDRPVQMDAAKADPPLILSVGILAHRKGHDILLRALAQITDLEWQADIVGRDHEAGMTAKLSAMIEDFDLSTRVRLSGEVSVEALQDRYRSATIFGLATRYEGYGIVFGEAMGHGLPIVSTRAGAVPETVGTQAGLLVDANDPEAFADALREMLIRPERRAEYASASLRAGAALDGWPEVAKLVLVQIGA